MRDFVRDVSMLRAHVRAEPLSKSRRGASLRAAIRTAIRDSADPWLMSSSRWSGRWPRPRADIALDVSFTTTRNSPPRLDSSAKWLLDELGSHTGPPIVYDDDRQVKLLWIDSYHRGDEAGEPWISVQAQTRTLALEGLHRAFDVVPSWRPDREHSSPYPDFDPDPFNISTGDPDLDREFRVRDRLQARGAHLDLRLQLVDAASVNVLRALASRRDPVARRIWDIDRTLAHLRELPLVTDLGVLPNQGESAVFESNVVDALTATVTENRISFPLLQPVGLTIFYVESQMGKDLDNLVRSVMTPVLRVLNPPPDRFATWLGAKGLQDFDDALNNGSPLHSHPHVEFVEVIAVPDSQTTDIAAGTVVLALSNGDRRHSWWTAAANYVRDLARDDYRADFREYE